MSVGRFFFLGILLISGSVWGQSPKEDLDLVRAQIQALHERLSHIEAQNAPKPTGKYHSFAQGFQVGIYALNQGDMSRAQQALSQVWETFPYHTYAPIAGYWLGVVHEHLNQDKAAVAIFQRLLKLYPKSPKKMDTIKKIAQHTWKNTGKEAACALILPYKNHGMMAELSKQWCCEERENNGSGQE